MANGFDFYHVVSGSLPNHDRYIVLFLHDVGISICYADVRSGLHIDHLSLGTSSRMSFRRQGLSGVLFDYLQMSNISTVTGAAISKLSIYPSAHSDTDDLAKASRDSSHPCRAARCTYQSRG